jgi:hypothetical protein
MEIKNIHLDKYEKSFARKSFQIIINSENRLMDLSEILAALNLFSRIYIINSSINPK